MLRFSLTSDGVEIASALFHLGDHPEPIVFQGGLVDNRMNRREPKSARRRHLHQRGVFKFTHQMGPHSL